MILQACITALLLLGAPQQKAEAPTPLPEIRGVVLEPGTNAPVVDAEISLFVRQPGPIRINGGWKQDDIRKARTDYSGAFTLQLEQPGAYRVEAKKTGYAADEEGATPDYAEATLTAEQPAAEVKLYLARPGQLTGNVIDEDTGEPIANLRLSAVRRRRIIGFSLGDGAPTSTDAEGKFAATGLPPGEYAVRIDLQTEQDKRVLTEFSAEGAKTVERDYERTYWPGGHGQEAVLPVTLVSGATMDVGRLSVKKVPYYRVHVRIPVSNCGDGDTMRISEAVLTPASIGIHSLAQVPCGKDVLVTGFSPGNYRLLLFTDGRTIESRGSASVPFSITDQNLEITAPLTPGVALEGALIAAEAAKPPDFAKVRISLRSVDGVGSIDDPMSAVPDPDGKFRFENVRIVGHRVLTSGLGPSNYVKEIRYNGIRLGGETVPLDQADLAHVLTIVVDDKPGTIAGVVVGGDKPISRPFIIVVKWPLGDDQLFSGWVSARGDDTGKFQVGGLAPGEYRIIALRSVDSSVSNATVQRALAAGKKIEISSGGSQSVTLEPAELR